MNQLIKAMDGFIGTIQDTNSYEYEGFKVPRVTAILHKCIHSDGIVQWANSLGYKHQSYRKTLDIAANIGTHAHNGIDNYLNDNSYIFNNKLPIESQYAYQSFIKWFNDISKNANVEVLMHEETLVCKYFGGTLDGLYKINGKIYLVDYKTSNHIRYNYTLQLAAYRYMLRELKGLEIDGCIILQLSKNQIGYNEFVLDLSTPEQLKYMDECEQTFLSLVFAYYNLNRTENGYKNLGWRE